ncbi:MAG: hypothetical protein HXY34_13400 [Candidatus Thorarchaeota archaeon]|nr:hypothetical protein [Candidatus Thorarchaeota archaeon]
MPFVERITTRAYSRGTEVLSRVQTAVLSLYPEAVRERVDLKVTPTEGHNQSPIMVLSADLRGKKDCHHVLTSILGRLEPSDRQTLMSTLEQRLDENCTLYIRVEKQDAYLGRVRLAVGPDLISIQVHLRDYPRCTPESVRGLLSATIESLEV